jgi:hypothetical protein
MRNLKYLEFLCAALFSFSGPVFSLPAFPGAEGFGSTTPGGRGGRVIEVTNLNDSGTGSLRAALTASEPRIVVFRLSGTIMVKSKISVTSPYLTVAGQTAPGGGITIKNDPSYGGMPLNIDTHDVIFRYLRVRPGAPASNSIDGGNVDAMDLSSYNIVVDHCSFSWATDENFTFGGARDSTFQWNIVAEGLGNATHPEGFHSKGLHLREGNSPNISVHHNVLAHNYDRNPNINTSGIVDLVNNVIYNATRWTEVKDKFGEPHVNVVNNYYKLGPDSESKGYEVFYYDNTGRNPQVYVSGNIGVHRPTDSLPQAYIVREDSRWMIVGSRFPAPPVTTLSAVSAFDSVLAKAGATLPARDAHDTRVTNDVRNGTGHVIDSPLEIGGWVMMALGTAPADSDHDGMPDAWETTHGFSITDATDGSKDKDGDGYTNVEEYLNGIDPKLADAGSGTPPPPPPPIIEEPPVIAPDTDTLTFAPIADATVNAGSPSINFGTKTTLEVDNSTLQNFLIKFAVSGIGTDKVISAKLRLYNVNSSNAGGDLYRIANNTWSESTLTWNNAPLADQTKFSSIGAVTEGNWYEVDVKPLITGDGTFSLRVNSTSSDGADYNSKEAAGFAPQLVLTVGNN